MVLYCRINLFGEITADESEYNVMNFSLLNRYGYLGKVDDNDVVNFMNRVKPYVIFIKRNFVNEFSLDKFELIEDNIIYIEEDYI